jgi:cysteine desulfurase/selenocysteine lyase
MLPEDLNSERLPDIDELQRIANEYFKALPNQTHFSNIPYFNPQLTPSSLQEGLPLIEEDQLPNFGNQEISKTIPAAGSPVAGEKGISPSTINQSNSFNVANPQTSLPDPHFKEGRIPFSVAGSGISPSAIQHPNKFDIKDPQTSLPDPHFKEGYVPASVAGSGISPSAIQHPQKFDIKDPQTSLPDPHFKEGKIPSSVAGSGISPSVAKHTGIYSGYNAYPEKAGNPNQFPISNTNSFAEIPVSPFSAQHIPYQSDLPFYNELNEVLSFIRPSIPGSPMEGTHSAISEPSFYFLSGGQSISHFMGSPQHGLHSRFEEKQVNGLPKMPFDVNLIRRDFPILHEQVNGRRIVWLDNAATTQKPKHVIDRVSYFYQHENSNIHRAAHELAARATDAYESARKKVQAFLNASSPNEIVFVRGATEAINLVAKSWGEQNLKEGDEIIISHLEHHANIVPWQQLSEKNGTKLKVIPVDDDGQVLLDEYSKLLGPKTKLVSFAHVSNALGTITPAKRMVEMAHQVGAKVLVDGAQTVSHMRADVRDLDCEWYVFSGHKVFGPTGIGVLYGKEDLLNETGPWQGGGNMIKDVTFEKTTYQPAPGRFEAGTGNIADAVGLGAALDYVNRIGIDLISQYEHYLLLYATKLLKDIPGLRLIGTAPDKAGVISFVLDGYKTEEVGAALNQYGVAVRSGHHCAQPILRRFGVEATVRPSLALYNTCSDIDTLVSVLQRLSSNRSKRRI